jgi:hypothetical protein
MLSPHKDPNTVWIDDSQWIHTPLYIPTYNELWITPSTHIHPDSSATQLSLTLKDLKPILQHQEQYLLDEYAQPPLISAKPIIHPDSSATQLGLTPEDIEEVLTHQEECMREQEEQEWRTGRHTIVEQTHYQCDQHNDEAGGQTPCSPLEHHMDSTANGHDTPVALFEPNDKLDVVVARTGFMEDDIRQLVHKLVTHGNTNGNWAEEVEEEINAMEQST